MDLAGVAVNQSVTCGDNLELMRSMDSQSIDLVYVDGPFCKGKVFKGNAGEFSDVFRWDTEAQELSRAFEDKLQRLILLAYDCHSPGMAAYLAFMAARINEMRRLLKTTGSLWLQCDHTANAYLRVLLDLLFGAGNRRDEVTYWRQSRQNNATKKLRNGTDTIYRYTKSCDYVFNADVMVTPYDEDNLPASIQREYRYRDAHGRLYRMDNLTAPGHDAKRVFEWHGKCPNKGWRYSREKMDALLKEGRIKLGKDGKAMIKGVVSYLDEKKGLIGNNRWDERDLGGFMYKEKTGYPTQKPVALLERIIAASSHEGDTVLDPFCGSGTTLVACNRLNRNGIGIDVNPDAVRLAEERQQGQTEAML